MEPGGGEARGIWVLVEHDEGQLTDAGARLLGVARGLGSGVLAAVDAAALDLEPASGALVAGRREWDGRLATTYTEPAAQPQVVTVRTAGALSPYYDDWRYGGSEVADLSGV